VPANVAGDQKSAAMGRKRTRGKNRMENVLTPAQLAEYRADRTIENAVTAHGVSHSDLVASLARIEAAKRDAADPRIKITQSEFLDKVAAGTMPEELKKFRWK